MAVGKYPDGLVRRSQSRPSDRCDTRMQMRRLFIYGEPTTLLVRMNYLKVLLFLLVLLLQLPAGAQTHPMMGYAKINGGTLYYEVNGRGETIVLIHGGQMDSRIWDSQVASFAKHYRVIRYDVRGYGRSGIPTTPYSNVEDLRTLLKLLKVEKAVLVGLSLGGRISIDFALEHPDMVAGLVLAGPGLSGFETSVQAQQRSGERIEAARDEGYSKAVELWLKDPYMIPAMENPRISSKIRQYASENAHVWLLNPYLERPIKRAAIDRLSEIRARTLVIVGDRDVPDIQAITDKLANGIAGAKKVIIKGAGHITPMEKPEEFNKTLLDFLAGSNP